MLVWPSALPGVRRELLPVAPVVPRIETAASTIYAPFDIVVIGMVWAEVDAVVWEVEAVASGACCATPEKAAAPTIALLEVEKLPETVYVPAPGKLAFKM